MGYLITGIILVVLPILTWFSSGFVEAAGTTIFFWAIGILMILVGADRITPGGIWKSSSGHDYGDQPEYKVIEHFTPSGKSKGYSKIPIRKK